MQEVEVEAKVKVTEGKKGLREKGWRVHHFITPSVHIF